MTFLAARASIDCLVPKSFSCLHWFLLQKTKLRTGLRKLSTSVEKVMRHMEIAVMV